MENLIFRERAYKYVFGAIFLLGLISFIFPLGTNPLNARNAVHTASAAFCLYPALVLLFSGKEKALLLVLGAGAFLAGNIFRGAYELVYSASIPAISAAAFLFSAGHIAISLFFALELAKSEQNRNNEAVQKIIGMGIPSLALGFVFWSFFLKGVAENVPFALMAGGTFAFILSSTFFLATLFVIPTGAFGERKKSAIFLSGAYFSFAVTSFYYLLGIAGGKYSSSSFLNFGWISALLFLGYSFFLECASGLPGSPEKGENETVKAN